MLILGLKGLTQLLMIRKSTVTFTLKITTNLDFMYLTVSSLNVSFSKKSIRN